MKAHQVVLVALVTAAALTSVAAAGSGATGRQHVTITTTVMPNGKFVLDVPLQPGAIALDRGTFVGQYSGVPDKTLVRDGQTIYVRTGVWTATGKLGTLVFRERNEWVEVGNYYSVAVGTWKVMRGTGQYAGVSGGGRSGHATRHGPRGTNWYARYEGFLTAP
jgi:hypothetical protein